MKSVLKKLKGIKAENCVTIILNTHRTSPDNNQDNIQLKNLVKEAENRILESVDKRVAADLIKRLKELEDSVDHNYNKESLILFVNKDISEIERLPLKVEDRVIIGDSFATRDLMRAIHGNSLYYVLVLSQQKARLIQAFNDKVVLEVTAPFPIENDLLHPKSRLEGANEIRQSNLMSEFFNQIDKVVNDIRKPNGLPVLICSDENNYHDYLKIADKPNTIFDSFLNGNRMEEKSHAIVKDAAEIVKNYTTERNNKRKEQLEDAVGTGKYLSDINDIHRAIKEGKIRTLFVEQGLFKPAIVNNDEIEIVSEDQNNSDNYVDDILDELLELNMSFGGENVFLPKGELEKFNGYGAITRY